MKTECIRIYCLESQHGDQPLQSCGFFFERKELFAPKLKKIVYVSLSGEMRSKCIRIYVVRKVNVAINPFRAVVFFERKELFARKLKKIASTWVEIDHVFGQ